MLPSIASSATTATVEAMSPAYPTPPYWHPEQVAVTTSGGTVTFINNSATVPHGVVWKSVPATPKCEEGAGQVPVGIGKWASSWKGGCTFTQEGVYKYYCAYHGEAMSGTIYVNASGTIPPPPPAAATEAATSVTETGATLKGAVNPNGQATEYFFKYGTTTGYGTDTSAQSAGTGTISVSASVPVTGLAPGTTYHFELVATYASGSSTVLGGDRTFTTASPPGAPAATTEAAASVTETGATLKGAVNPNGQATEYFFKYGTTTGYGTETSAQSAGAGMTSVSASAPVTGLAPGTTYHFQLVAHNASGAAPGADHTFTTTAPPPPKEPPSEPPSEPPPTGTTTTTPFVTPPPPSTPLFEPPLGPALVGAPSLRSTQRGPSVKGSLDVSQTGAGGSLEVDVLAKSASLAVVHRSGPVRVGRLVRASVSAGKVSFSIGLSARAKSALHRHHRLALTVRIVLTPTHGAAVTITKSVSLRV
jgi:plastocyanin